MFSKNKRIKELEFDNEWLRNQFEALQLQRKNAFDLADERMKELDAVKADLILFKQDSILLNSVRPQYERMLDFIERIKSESSEIIDMS